MEKGLTNSQFQIQLVSLHYSMNQNTKAKSKEPKELLEQAAQLAQKQQDSLAPKFQRAMKALVAKFHSKQ